MATLERWMKKRRHDKQQQDEICRSFNLISNSWIAYLLDRLFTGALACYAAGLCLAGISIFVLPVPQANTRFGAARILSIKHALSNLSSVWQWRAAFKAQPLER